jgi:pimeloyl-[acyl-carrier protein] synthase
MSEPVVEQVEFNPSTAEFRADPYSVYAALRAEAAPHWSEYLDAWVVSRYDDATAVLRENRFKLRPATGFEARQHAAAPSELMSALMTQVYTFMDPPDHTRLRALVAKAFTPRVVEALRPRIQQLVDDLLAPAIESGTMDVMAELAYPLPVIVVSELLGVPESDRPFFLDKAGDLAALLEWDVAPERLEQGGASMIEFAGYFSALIHERGTNPRADLISGLLATEEGGHRLDHGEVLTICVLLLTVGYETTMNLLGNGVYTLAANPDAAARLRDDQCSASTAVDELLRYESPVQLTARTALEDLQVGGLTLAAEEQVVVIMGSANRDAARFVDPERLDLDRAENRHLAFGHGGHFCLGAALARIEGEIVYSTLVRTFGSIELTAPPAWRSAMTLRAHEVLPVAVGPPRPRGA